MTEEDMYEPGEEVLYHEGGEIDRVRVLENKSGENRISYKLKVLSVEQESAIFKSARVGSVFECDKKRGCSGGDLWYLLNN